MKTKLSQEDIKNLKYQLRPGIIIPLLILIPGFIMLSSLLSGIHNYKGFAGTIHYPLVLIITLGVSGAIAYLMIGKILQDISNKEKMLEVKTIQKKESIIDFEAGSGTMYLGQKMKRFDNYSIIINNTRYRVDKDFYETCNAGDEVTFHIAPKSKHRLKMELNKNKLENKIF